MKCKRLLFLRIIQILFLIIFLTNCSIFKSSKKIGEPLKKISDNSFIVFVALDKVSYKPNDAVIATVQLQNISKKTIKIPSLDIKSLSFYKIQKNTGNTNQVYPIFSPKESLLNFEDIKPKDWRRRQFVFTDCTDTTGEFTLYAIYSSSGSETVEGRPKFISTPFYFSVSGEPNFKRDKKGILLKEDAIKIAANKLGEKYNSVRANLIINEAGFYDWWITFNLNKDGKEVEKAYLVNPYLCVVRKEVLPYKPTTKGDEREKALEELREKALKNKEKPGFGEN
jgi:hypothetical protein